MVEGGGGGGGGCNKAVQREGGGAGSALADLGLEGVREERLMGRGDVEVRITFAPQHLMSYELDTNPIRIGYESTYV